MIRIKKRTQEEEQTFETESDPSRRTIGAAINRGSIHKDIWKGPAVEIAQTNALGVYPVVGWWHERNHLQKYSRKTRYALVVSLPTPEQDVDLYTSVATRVGITTPGEINVY